MIERGLILNPEYVKSHKVACEKCGQPAFATHHDMNYETHEYCQRCYPQKEPRKEFSHYCPDVPDNYGAQVVKEGERCPFCGIAATGTTEQS